MEERFWSKVDRRAPDECWPWKAALQGGGYGTFWLDGKQHPAHRVAFLIANGHWPENQVDHRCHNEDMSCNALGAECPHRRCVNPAHLVDATGSQNQQARRTRCRQGHPWVRRGVDYEVLPPTPGRPSEIWTCLHCAKLNRERVARDGQRHRKSVCKRGHDLTAPENVYIAPDGRRICVPCRRENLRALAQRRRGGAPPLSREEAGTRGAQSRWKNRHDDPSSAGTS